MTNNEEKVKTVQSYIAGFPEDTQKVLKKMRSAIRKAVPRGEEVISYGIPCVKFAGRYVIYFAGWKSHVSVYPIPKGSPAFQKAIAPFVAGRGTLKFSLREPVPYTLITEVARFRLAQSKVESLYGKKTVR